MYICIPPDPIESSVDVQSENHQGLSDEDYPRWKDRWENKERAIEYTISETGSREVASIPNEVLPKLLRYETMSEQEKRQLESQLSKRIFGSKEMREFVETLSEALHEVDALLDESEVEQ